MKVYDELFFAEIQLIIQKNYIKTKFLADFPKDSKVYLLLDLPWLLCHFFSQHLYLIRLSKMTYPSEFLDSSNHSTNIYREINSKK
jgi:hypothetical protein